MLCAGIKSAVYKRIQTDVNIELYHSTFNTLSSETVVTVIVNEQ